MDNFPVVVLGMHRSYTSVLASWLHTNGVQMYPGEAPEDGLYEDAGIRSMHIDLLKANGMHWINARPPILDPEGIYSKRVARLWEERSIAGEQWGWKDPRTMILFKSVWSAYLDRVRFIFIYREPLEVVRSLYYRRLQRTLHGTSAFERAFRARSMRVARKRWQELFLRTWITYNRAAYHLVNSLSDHHAMTLDGNNLAATEQQLRTRLESWGLRAGSTSISSMVRTSALDAYSLPDDLRPDLVAEARTLCDEITALTHRTATF